MGAIWLIASREFRERIRRRGFILAALATPLLLIVIWVATALLTAGLPPMDQAPGAPLAAPPHLRQPIGYVDQAGLIRRIPPPLRADRVRGYADVAAGEEALRSGEIVALYVIPEDYVETGAVRRLSPALPSAPPDEGALDWLLVGNLFPEVSADELARLMAPLGAGGPELVATGPEPEAEPALNIVPFLATVAIMLPLLTGGGYLFQCFAEEKEGRVLEILLLSTSPTRLLAGKLLGIGALTLVQYLAWGVVVGPLALVIGSVAGDLPGSAGVPAIEGLGAGGAALPGGLPWMIPFAAAGFVLYATLAAGIGALAPSTESSRSWLFLISLPMLAPLYVWLVVVQSPQGPLAVAMSLFPPSAPAGMMLRLSSGPVPAWQLSLSLALLIASAVGLLLALARIFRLRLLLSGERLSPTRLWRALLAG